MYRWRAKIGLIVPSTNTVMESEFHRMLMNVPISVHSTRLLQRKQFGDVLKDTIEMTKQTERAVRELASANVDIILFGCTLASFMNGTSGEKGLVERIERAGGMQAVTASGAVAEALDQLQIVKVVIITPYGAKGNRLLRQFLEQKGCKIIHMKGADFWKTGKSIGDQPPELAYRMVRENFIPKADGTFISCTNFRTIEIIETLERDTNKPVITSNQALLWAALRKIGVKEPIDGYGKLMRTF